MTQVENGTMDRPGDHDRQLDFSATPLVLAGYSHIYSLIGIADTTLGFAAATEFRVDPVDGIPGLWMGHGEWPRTDAYWERLQAFASREDEFAIGLSYRGNEHLARFLLQREMPIDFFSSEFPDLPIDPEAQLIPEMMAEALFSPFYEPLAETVRNLRSTGRRVVLIGTPPPKGDDAFLRQMIANEEHFVRICEMQSIPVDEVEFTRLSTRVKLWGVIQAIIRQGALAGGGSFLPAPRLAIEEDGSLRREYWNTDCTHANCAYGRLVLQDLLDHLGQPEA